jgi:hypothetical protein
MTQYYIGIDCGTKTGFAIYDKSKKCLSEVKTLRIDEALLKIKHMHEQGYEINVIVEDARKRKWFGNSGREKLQGAGSVKRDSKIWQDFLEANKIPHTMKAPAKGMTKLNAEQFKKITGWVGRTSEHGRDAAMLVFGF